MGRNNYKKNITKLNKIKSKAPKRGEHRGKNYKNTDKHNISRNKFMDSYMDSHLVIDSSVPTNSARFYAYKRLFKPSIETLKQEHKNVYGDQCTNYTEMFECELICRYIIEYLDPISLCSFMKAFSGNKIVLNVCIENGISINPLYLHKGYSKVLNSISVCSEFQYALTVPMTRNQIVLSNNDVNRIKKYPYGYIKNIIMINPSDVTDLLLDKNFNNVNFYLVINRDAPNITEFNSSEIKQSDFIMNNHENTLMTERNRDTEYMSFIGKIEWYSGKEHYSDVPELIDCRIKIMNGYMMVSYKDIDNTYKLIKDNFKYSKFKPMQLYSYFSNNMAGRAYAN